MRRYRHRGVWIAGIWLAIALVNATQNIVGLRGEGVRRPLTYHFVYTTLSWLVWACATPLVLRMAQRFPPVRNAGPRAWLAHGWLWLAIALANALWGNLLLVTIQPWGTDGHPRPFAEAALARFLSQFHLNLIYYAGIVAVGHTIESRRRAAELTAQLSQAQLDALRRQLEPHFLFNTLNAIAGLVRDQRNQDAVSMIAGLSDLLRRVVEDSGRQQILLGEEMEFLERYLEIQRARFAERLHVTIDMPPELRTAQVPSLILQPLVENAIQHGKPVHRERDHKIEPWKAAIAELLEKDPGANAPVIAQRLQPLGFDGGLTIIKDYLRTLRKNSMARRAYVRVEPGPGERFDVDWRHFGALVYNGATRKLYGFCLVEAHSRKMYLEFTHSQTFETFARCHIHAFRFFNGVSREIWFDNLATAVAEHDGNLVRFNPRFLAFARECGFIPRACHVRAPWEKGKVERAIGYIRQNFWPLRSFTGLPDLNAQARQWLKEIANQRQHREAGQKPEERFQPESLRPLPAMIPDYRDTAEALVYKDIRLSFDGNRYCVPARLVGSKLTVKADSSSLTIYDQHHEVATYSRSWQRGQTLGAERFEKELRAQMAAAERSAAQQRLIALLGPTAHEYLERLADTDRSLSRQVRELFALVREYGPEVVAAALAKEHAARAFGADYVANILRQQ